jgi:hypothetical protein
MQRGCCDVTDFHDDDIQQLVLYRRTGDFWPREFSSGWHAYYLGAGCDRRAWIYSAELANRA